MVGLQIHAILHGFGPEFYFCTTLDLDAIRAVHEVAY